MRSWSRSIRRWLRSLVRRTADESPAVPASSRTSTENGRMVAAGPSMACIVSATPRCIGVT